MKVVFPEPFGPARRTRVGIHLCQPPWDFCLAYAVLMLVRIRWLNILLLTAGLIYCGWEVIPMRLAG